MPIKKEIVITRQKAGRTLELEGRTWRYFSGAHYLGIQADPEFAELVTEGLSIWGAHFGGSRRSNLRLSIFEESENLLAGYCGAEAALILSSGSLAGQMLLHHLQSTDHLYCAPNVHPALCLPGTAPAAGWGSWLETLLRDAPTWKRPVSLILNRMDPLLARTAPLDWLEALPSGVSYRLIVDDSHYLGVLGANGGGSYSDLKLPPNFGLVVVSSLGKALGLPAGVILGSSELINRLWGSSLFGGASPPPPAYLHAFVRGRDIYQAARARLQARINEWENFIAGLGLFSSFPGFPVYYTRHNELAAFLEKYQVLISSFPYPSPDDPLVTRVILNALHTSEDLGYLALCLKEFVLGTTKSAGGH